MILAHITLPLIIYGIFHGLNPTALLALLVGANISSLDVLPTLIRKQPPTESTEEAHAATVLHTLFFFAVCFVPLYFMFNLYIALAFMIGGFTHVLIDALDEKGRMLLYPFSRKFYGPRLFTYDFWTYTTNVKIFTLEAALFFAAFFLMFLR
jgi:membrane-bound metal-dependent hydrolase YbcI (DUF457 family)